MSDASAEDFVAINDLLCRFFAAFDDKDWEAMSAVLAEEVFIDYSASGREAPTRIKGADFVTLRRNAVDALSKQHGFSNLLLTRNGEGVRGSCNYLIFRFALDFAGEGADHYHSCGKYWFDFTRQDGSWKIAGIVQKSLRSWGNRDLHRGSNKQKP
jgi:3-phenylpropionate/cinnamic acid dioxygenase small subunit